MFLQSHLYYQLRAIDEMVARPEECFDITPGPELLRLGVQDTLDTAETTFLNMLELAEGKYNEVSEAMNEVMKKLWALSDNEPPSAFYTTQCLWPFIDLLENKVFQVFEKAGYPDPSQCEAMGMRIEGRGFPHLLVPCMCEANPSLSFGFYTEDEKARAEGYLKRTGVLGTLVGYNELEFDFDQGHWDWVISHVCALGAELTYKIRGRIFAQLWSKQLAQDPA